MTIAYKFDATLNPGTPLEVPKDIGLRIPPGSRVEVIVLIDDIARHDLGLHLQEAALRQTWDDPAEDLYGEV